MLLKSFFRMNGLLSVLFLLMLASQVLGDKILIVGTANIDAYATNIGAPHTLFTKNTNSFSVTDINRSTYDQIWLMPWHDDASVDIHPDGATGPALRTFLSQGGKVALFTDAHAVYNNSRPVTVSFVNTVVASGTFSLPIHTVGDMVMDPVGAAIADPQSASLFVGKTFKGESVACASGAGLAGGIPVMQMSNNPSYKPCIVFDNSNLASPYSNGRLTVFGDIGYALYSANITANQNILKFIAAFATGATSNIAISPTEVKEDTTIAKGSDDLTFTNRTHTVNFKVALDDTLDEETTVEYEVSFGTAGVNDFNIPSMTGTLTFGTNAADTVEYIPIEIIDDIRAELDETFSITLRNSLPANNIIFLTGDSLVETITIIDDDPEFSNIPIANTDSINLDEGATTTVLSYKNGETSVLWNDTDPDTINGDALTVTIKTDVSYGTLTLNSNGTFEYTHNGNEFFTDQFTYTITDKGSNTATGTVIISINPVNDNWPDAKDTSFTLLEGGTLNIPADGILKYDSDVDVDQNNTTDYDWLHASLKSLDSTSYGTLTLNADGSFDYVHDGSENFTDYFTYYSIDSVGHKDSALVTINITPVNDNTPVTTVGYIVLDENTTVDSLVSGVKNLLDSTLVTDADGINDSLYISSTPINVNNSIGKITVNADGTFLYEYIADSTVEVFTDTVKYSVSDKGNLHTVTVNIIVTINPTNDNLPDAVDDVIGVDKGANVTVLIGGQNSVLWNDKDLDFGDSIFVTLVDSPTTYTAFSLNSDGTFSYTHNGSNDTTDSFKYIVTDKAGHTDTATVSIKVAPKNLNNPIANSDSINVNEGASATKLTNNSTSLINNDTDVDLPFDGLTVTVLSYPLFSDTLILNSDGTFEYKHDDSENFTDSFTYTLTDAAGHTDIGTVYITINPTNDNSPITSGDTINVNEGGTATVLTNGNSSVLDNDSDVDESSGHDSLFATLTDSTGFGSLTFNSDGTFSYTHDGTENFSDQFIYTVSDTADPNHTQQQVVTIIINSVNADPVAVVDSIIVDEGGYTDTLTSGENSLLSNDTDVDLGDIITADTTLIIPAKFGTFLLMSSGTFSYQHDGSENFIDSVTYQISDKSGATSQATVYINITAVNDIPVVLPDSIIVKEGDSTTILVSGEKSVIANDSDADVNGKINWIVKLVTDVKFGSLFLDSTTGEFKYVHEGSQNYLNEFFKYKIIDGDLESEIITVPITIIPTLSLVKYASYHDADANGHIDSIVFIFDKPIIDVDSLGLSLAWNDDPQNIYHVSSENITSVKSKDTLIVNVEDLFSTQLQTSGGLLAMLNYKDFDSTVLYPVADKAAPVIIRAEYLFKKIENSTDLTGADSLKFDALLVDFSEPIGAINGDYPFNFEKVNSDKDQYQMELEIEDLTSDQALFKVLSLKGAFYPDKGDSAWIFADTADYPEFYVADNFNNKQAASYNRRVPLILEVPDLDVSVQILHIVGKTKTDTKIPDELKVEGINFTEGAVLLLTSDNPGNSQEVIDHLKAARKQVSIFDLVGNEIISIDNESSEYLAMDIELVSGKPALRINWNGMNANGRAVASGSYVIIVKLSDDPMFENKEEIKKVNVKQFME